MPTCKPSGELAQHPGRLEHGEADDDVAEHQEEACEKGFHGNDVAGPKQWSAIGRRR
jgi:hypothetical protein